MGSHSAAGARRTDPAGGERALTALVDGAGETLSGHATGAGDGPRRATAHSLPRAERVQLVAGSRDAAGRPRGISLSGLRPSWRAVRLGRAGTGPIDLVRRGQSLQVVCLVKHVRIG